MRLGLLWMPIASVSALMMGCSEYSVSNICVEKSDGFDIEEVSVLQDAAGYPSNRDAVVLSRNVGTLNDGESWTITRVDVLAMVPEWAFNDYSGGDVLTVELYDSESPRESEPYVVSQAIDVDALEWEKLRLPETAFWAGLREELDQRKAWMSFDFSDVVPAGGIQSEAYTVGVSWGSKGLPTIGYSNFDLDCSKNWTDHGEGTWDLNSEDGSSMDCSWPMLRVGVESRLFTKACEGETLVVE
jgi:hypothetical protein